jgi:hypothetical protein
MGWRRAMVLACGLACAGGLRAQNVSEQYLLAAANQDRAAHGLLPVKVDSHLVLAARVARSRSPGNWCDISRCAAMANA